ncbi:MAG: DNA methyltransferase [Thermoflexales bacterium]|nr:DNA methyltransferase [Thermoflexales bacterium]
MSALRSIPESSLDFILLAAGRDKPEVWKAHIEGAARALRPGGMLFVQGTPENLPEIGVHAERHLRFKYWIAVESILQRTRLLPSSHAGVLMFVKGDAFRVSKVRVPHQACRACCKNLKDWGGKSHLMHPEGTAISDVWRDLPPMDNYSGLSRPALERLLAMVSPTGQPADAARLDGWISPIERIGQTDMPCCAESQQPYLPLVLQAETTPQVHACSDVPQSCVIQGDAAHVLAKLPDESVDLVFADPPYNLDKAYATYDDELEQQAYLQWCESWLAEYVRVLKPSGSLFLLNLPRWAMHHAAFLNRHLYFQNWIVWDAMSEPRGKIMPAHYALLFYTKRPIGFTFNYDAVSPIDARGYCLRASCIRQRKAHGDDDKEPLTDIWWDIHRIKHRRDRDHHPCQLPDALMERIIRLSTNPGDLVLDALAGTGTTALAAARLGRRYIAIDLDPNYVALMREKLKQVEVWGEVPRAPTRRLPKPYSKRALQLELRQIAEQLGRLPTPEDVRRLSRFDLELFQRAFPTWGKALKAAKLVANVSSTHASQKAHLR